MILDSSEFNRDERALVAAAGVPLDELALIVAPVHRLQISTARDAHGSEVVVMQATVIVSADLLDIRETGLVDEQGTRLISARAQRAIVGASPAIRLLVRRESLGEVGALLLGEPGEPGELGELGGLGETAAAHEGS